MPVMNGYEVHHLYVTKPFQVDELVAKIEDALATTRGASPALVVRTGSMDE